MVSNKIRVRMPSHKTLSRSMSQCPTTRCLLKSQVEELEMILQRMMVAIQMCGIHLRQKQNRERRRTTGVLDQEAKLLVELEEAVVSHLREILWVTMELSTSQMVEGKRVIRMERVVVTVGATMTNHGQYQSKRRKKQLPTLNTPTQMELDQIQT